MQTELKNHVCNRFYGISCEGHILMERAHRNADISILSNLLAIFWQLFSRYREIYQVLSAWQISDQLDNSNRNYREGQNLPSPAIPISKKPGLFRVKNNANTRFCNSNNRKSISSSIRTTHARCWTPCPISFGCCQYPENVLLHLGFKAVTVS